MEIFCHDSKQQHQTILYFVYILCNQDVTQQKCTVKIQQNSFFQINGPSYFQTEFYLPKCLIIKSQKPYFKLQTNLIKIHRELRNGNNYVFQPVNQNLYSSDYTGKRQNISSDFTSILRSSVIGSISKSQFPKELSNKKESRNKNLQNLFSYYIWAANQQLYKDKIYICPSSGMEILHTYNISDSLYRFNYFFHLPISMENLTIILSAILQQKQIIFTSNNQNSNLMLMQTLLEILRPLKWQFMYVPNLPESMLDAAEHSFMPYMVGVHRKYLDKINQSGRVIVFVDSDQIKTDQHISALPSVLRHNLMYAEQNFTNLKYLQWQLHMRIRSILFVTSLLIQFSIVQLKHYQNKDYQFYSFFFEKSAMYSTFKQQMYKQVNSQISYLFWIPSQIKVKLLEQKFQSMLFEASEPIVCEIDKEWTKYHLLKIDQNKRSLKRNNTNSWSRSTISQNSMKSQILTASFSAPEVKQQVKQKINVNNKKKIGFISSTVRI